MPQDSIKNPNCFKTYNTVSVPEKVRGITGPEEISASPDTKQVIV
jgi:hypothetical protein